MPCSLAAAMGFVSPTWSATAASWGVTKPRTVAALKAHRRELIDREIAGRGGRLVSAKGDGVLAEFPSVVAAVEGAVAIQRAMADRNRDIPPEGRIEFRIGVHLDEVLADGDDILGEGVNVAARLEAFADPGTVCLSGAVFNRVKNRVVTRSTISARSDSRISPSRSAASTRPTTAPRVPGPRGAARRCRCRKSPRSPSCRSWT